MLQTKNTEKSRPQIFVFWDSRPLIILSYRLAYNSMLLLIKLINIHTHTTGRSVGKKTGPEK